MQKLPVSSAIFWKQRLRTADDREQLHHSIYICNPEMWKKIERIHREILAREIEPWMNVLDAGCGYGRFADLNCQYTGMDISPDLLARARASYPNISFHEADLTKIPAGDKLYDVAFCVSIRAMILNNLGEQAWDKICKELTRVAKKVILLEYEDPEVYHIL